MTLSATERRDLRHAWNSNHDASEKLNKLSQSVNTPEHAKYILAEALALLSDSRRLIDRVEQGRGNGKTIDHVVMYNDYPIAIYASELSAKAHVVREHTPDDGKFVRVYPIEVQP